MKKRFLRYMIINLFGSAIFMLNTNAQAQSLSDDTKTITDLLSSQGDTHHKVNIGEDLVLDEYENYSIVQFENCTLTSSYNDHSKSYSSKGNNSMSITYQFTFSLLNIDSIEIQSKGKTNELNFIYDMPIYKLVIHLKNPVLGQRTLYESTMVPDNFKLGPAHNISYTFTNAENSQKMMDTLNHMAQLCGVPKPASQQTAEDLPAQEQEHYKQVLTHGKPAVMYSTALDLADEQHYSLALAMLQALIEKYPDDGYTAKAIDKKEAIRNQLLKSSVGARKVANFQAPPVSNPAQIDNDNGNIEKGQACHSSCQTTKNSCDMTYSSNMGTQLGNTINGLRGHNSAAAQQAGSQILGDPNACQNEYDSCTARCGG